MSTPTKEQEQWRKTVRHRIVNVMRATGLGTALAAGDIAVIVSCSPQLAAAICRELEGEHFLQSHVARTDDSIRRRDIRVWRVKK